MAPLGSKEIPVESARRISQFFRNQGYTEEGLSGLGLGELPLNVVAAQSTSRWTLTGDLRLDFSIRLFFFGEVVGLAETERWVPPEILDDLLTIGILRHHGEQLRATCMLTHFGEMILASDSRPRGGQAASDLVLGVNPTTRLLARCSMLRPGGKALDLGTGCGTLALTLALSAGWVMASDINPRALDFGKINAALNGVSNVTFVQGDRFDPVVGSRFDLILSNPPFFLAPASGLLYCESGMELDGFVESLARKAGRFLEENGVFQMLCEWVEFATEPWEPRLKPWFEGSQCDVHVWQGYEYSPAEYARKRALEQGHLKPEAVMNSFGERLFYLHERGVTRVFGGLISMRRRSGHNWFWVEEMQKRPSAPIGAALWERFITRDLLESQDEQMLLGSRPRLAEHVHLVSEAVPRDGVWSTERSYLERTDDLPAKLGLDAVVGQLVARFEGRETLKTLLTQLASEQRAPLDQVILEGLRIVKQLGTAGFILFQ